MVVPATPTLLPFAIAFRLSKTASACLAMASICNIISSSSNANFDGGRFFRDLRFFFFFFVVISNTGIVPFSFSPSSIEISDDDDPLWERLDDRIDFVERRDLAVAKVSSSLSRSCSSSTATSSTSWSANMSSILAATSSASISGAILKLGLRASSPAPSTEACVVVWAATSSRGDAISSLRESVSLLPSTDTSSASISSSTLVNFWDKFSSFLQREEYLLFSFPSLSFDARFPFLGVVPGDAPS
mmetsp:Transcript_29530/g.63599  ORF Transcript_29530/g.63599 Transcript_29530/m.63599 type:complete len:245 (+) Transcript_29530:1114-1848(+)